ncbi:LacI family DNA-binding transcriptional regulator [Companilactobacillus keshanensis]|uniref:LacI family DNA-binding transcriptional regulator n=1 Tax=Companilactobacillus keshanensis TaxID=2486003 RepID=A0ABW4BS28_9LACO|nr:LacI family DNA-binding transcriptional regulator [Companilactobacillus keshanensis]
MITIRDIAKKAGVSASTASRALNNNSRISETTIKKVKKIADEMGYLPDYNAKNLTNGEANAVGVVFPVGSETASNPFFINILSGINSELVKRQYSLSVAIDNTESGLLDNVRSMVLQGKIKRFILLYSKLNDAVSAFLRKSKLRFVVIGQPTSKDDFYVDNNNVEAGITATEFLLKNLHVKNPLFVESTSNWTYEQQRYQGFKKVSNESLVDFDKIQVSSKNIEKIEEFIFDNPQIDGIVSTDDFRGLRFLNHFKKIYPKKNLSIVGFNKSFPIALIQSDFHSIDVFPEQMGIKTVILLFSDRENPEINLKRHLIVSHQVSTYNGV